MTDNLVPFMDRLSEKQIEFLLYVLNLKSDRKLHEGSLWFVNREAALRVLSFDEVSGEYAELVMQDIIDILQTGEWIDITTMADTKRRLLNNQTGSIREGELDYPSPRRRGETW